MPKITQNFFSCNLLACFCKPAGTITYHVQENGHVEGIEQSVDSTEGRLNFHEEKSTTELAECSQGVRIPGDSVAVMAYSTDPYVQFRQAMTEMLKYRLEQRMVVDWDYLEELLTCYMELNERNCHGDILMAYVDVVNEFYRLNWLKLSWEREVRREIEGSNADHRVKKHLYINNLTN